MAGKYDLSHLGKRALNTIKKNGGDTFLDKVIASRNFADGLDRYGRLPENGIRFNRGYGNQRFINYPCVGLCPDENGNMVWIPSSKKPLDRRDLFQITGVDFNDVDSDPLSYVDELDDFVRDYARGLVNGDIDIDGGLEGIVNDKGWMKFQKVNKDGSITRKSNVYQPFSEDGADSESSRYSRKFDFNVEHPQNKRKQPYRYINVFGPTVNPFSCFADNDKPGKFINPGSVLGSDVKKLKKENSWNFDDWDMRTIKNNGRYDISDKINRKNLIKSRGVSRGPARHFTEMNDEVGYVPYRLYVKRRNEVNEKYDDILDKMREDIIKNPLSRYKWYDYKKLCDRKWRELDKLENRMGIK